MQAQTSAVCEPAKLSGEPSCSLQGPKFPCFYNVSCGWTDAMVQISPGRLLKAKIGILASFPHPTSL